MKHFKLLAVLFVTAAIYAGTVAFSPIAEQAKGKEIMFETNDLSEVKRVKDLLDRENMLKVEEIAKSGKIRIRIKIQGKKKNGPIIVIEGRV